DVAHMDFTDKLEIVVEKTIVLLPADVGQYLRSMITKEALITMAGILIAWVVAHFFGVGEIADFILVAGGYIALGATAIDAAHKLYDFADKTYNATTEADLDEAAHNLADAITLIGVNAVLALLLKNKPKDTFNTPYRGRTFPKISTKQINGMKNVAPRTPGWRYKPNFTITRANEAGLGSTDIWGNAKVGRAYDRTQKTAKEAIDDLHKGIFHERVHQYFSPKFYLLREPLVFLKQSGYNKSYILRYVEEAFSETVALMRKNGLSPKSIVDGLRFPLNNNYELSIVLLRHEATGVLLGPITVSSMVYNVYCGAIK
ncbi:hypothetical protein G5C90_004284, partial [Salmonella enterica]|nr:hypothetical protein [Salmonella enterica]